MSDPEQTWVAAPSPSSTALPPGATDAHCHVFGPYALFPQPPSAKYTPAEAPKEALFALHDRYGIERCVVVQSGVHGLDNAVVEDAMQARPGRYLGVALVPAEPEASGLARLAGTGFRGVRFNYMAHLSPGASIEQLRALAPRLADLGMHLQLHMEASLLAGMAPTLAELPVPVVIDHMARVDASQGLSQPAFLELMRLMERDHVWTKVSGCERASRQDAPWADAAPFARRLVEAHPDRVLWGTDWPHPNFRADPPDDGALFDNIAAIAPTPALMRALMVDNPQRLYRFPSAEGA